MPLVQSHLNSLASAANTTEQNIQFKVDIIPGLGRLIDIVLHCTQSVTNVSDSSTTAALDWDIGTSAGGTEYIAGGAGACDDSSEVLSLAADGLGHIVVDDAATKVYLGGTPDANWNALYSGKWDVYVIYYDVTDLD